MEQLKLGILGAGSISSVMAKTVAQMDGVAPYAVAARDMRRAEAFAREHGVERAYGSYEEMLADPAVQLVYVATPHSHHHEHAKLCLEAGKHVLCEKAFTANAAQAADLISLARQKGLLLVEAIWTRFLPISKTISGLLADGAIGRVTGLAANLGYDIKHIKRMCSPELAGGALLDLGVYPINFASMVLGGDVASVTSCAAMYPTGVDAQDSITLCYADGAMAQLRATMLSVTDRMGFIYGETGYMVVENINNPASVAIYNPDYTLRETHERPAQISGYEYEMQAAVDAIAAGRTECPEMPLAESLRIMQLMDSLRGAWGLRYPFWGE